MHDDTCRSCTCNGCQRAEFEMKGKVKGNVDGCSVMLQKYGLEGVTNLDSVTIKNGEFTLKGVVNQPEQYQMVIDMNKPGTAEPDYQKYSQQESM